MAKVRTMGPPMTIRLPLRIHSEIQDRAAAAGETARAFLQRTIAERVERELRAKLEGEQMRLDARTARHSETCRCEVCAP